MRARLRLGLGRARRAASTRSVSTRSSEERPAALFHPIETRVFFGGIGLLLRGLWLRSVVVRTLFLSLLVHRGAGATNEVGRAVQGQDGRSVRLGVEQEVSKFDLSAASGTRYTLAGRGDWDATSKMAVRVRAPVHGLWLAGGRERVGLGDTELRLKLRLVDVGGYFQVQAGLIETYPTGSSSQGLGNGAMVGTPYVTAGRKFGRTIFYAYVSDAITLRNAHARQFDDFTDPSSNHETRNALGVMGGPFDALQANLSVSSTTILTGNAFGDTFVSAGTIVAVSPTDAFRVQLGAQVPVLGERRFDWKGTLDLYLSL